MKRVKIKNKRYKLRRGWAFAGLAACALLAGLAAYKINTIKLEKYLDEKVSQQELDDFFANEISAVGEAAYDIGSADRNYALTIPYDGKIRTIACYGDSMTEGYGSGKGKVTVGGETWDISYCSYPEILQRLTGIRTYNFGVSGERSDEIAMRAGGVKLVTDRDVTVGPNGSSLFYIVREDDGSVAEMADYSGYGIEDNAYPNSVYINDVIYNITSFSDGFRLTPVSGDITESGDKEGETPAVTSNITLGISESSVGQTGKSDEKIDDNDKALEEAEEDADLADSEYEADDSGDEEYALSYDSDDSDDYDTNEDSIEYRHIQDFEVYPTSQLVARMNRLKSYSNMQYNANRDGDDYTMNDLALTLDIENYLYMDFETKSNAVYNSIYERKSLIEAEVVRRMQNDTKKTITIPAGSEVKTKVSEEHADDILILEIGSNGGWESDYQVLIDQYNNIIANSGCKYYIIVGDTDDPGTSFGDLNQGYRDDMGNPIGIGNTAWEAALYAEYGDHFLNTRTFMIKNGLQLVGKTPKRSDLNNYKLGNISKRLRSDWTHFNAYGYYAKAVGIYRKGQELGYWK